LVEAKAGESLESFYYQRYLDGSPSWFLWCKEPHLINVPLLGALDQAACRYGIASGDVVRGRSIHSADPPRV